VVGFYHIRFGGHRDILYAAGDILLFGRPHLFLDFLISFFFIMGQIFQYILWVLAGLGAAGLLYYLITYLISVF
jgi:hypothetical protein